MSALYANLRRSASHQAVMESWKNTSESNNYDAIKKLNLPAGTVLENRGVWIDVYQRRGGLSQGELDAVNSPGLNDKDQYREWCGRFIYYCYSEALKAEGPNASLPFSPGDLWSGYKFRVWADQYKDNLYDRKSKTTRLNALLVLEDRQDRMVSVLDDMIDDPQKRILSAHPELVNEIKLVQDLSQFRIWDNHISPKQDPKTVQVEPGDIFTLDSGHIGLASGNSYEGRFETIEGNQSTAMGPMPGNSVKDSRKTVAECSLIIRI